MKAKILSTIAITTLLASASITPVYADGDGPDAWRVTYMHAMDGNSDDKITKEEFMKMSAKMAEKKFMMMDMDNDGIISKEEFLFPNPER